MLVIISNLTGYPQQIKILFEALIYKLVVHVLRDTDLNNDGVTNQVDVSQYRTLFGSNNDLVDYNGDGIVNPLDVNILREEFVL